jgi:magnesium transporter
LGQCSGVVNGVKNSGHEPDQEQPRSIRAFPFDAEGADEEVRSEDLSSQKVSPRQLLWIDVNLRDPRALADIGSALPIEPESLERMQESPSRPHLQDFEEYFHLNVQSLVASSEEGGPEQIDCVVGQNWVLTAHRENVELIDSFLAPIRGETELGRVEGPVFLAIVLDWVLSGYFRAIEELETRMDQFDQSLIARDMHEGSEQRLLSYLVELRHAHHGAPTDTLGSPRGLRHALAARIRQGLQVGVGVRYRVLSERLDKAIAAAENARETAMGSLNIVMTRTAQRTNHVMKMLTVISAVLLPALVIAGILGMNFRQSFFERTELFWVVVVLMVALGAGIVAFARHRKWF